VAAVDTILVTGAAGFIGYHVSRRLLESGRAVVGIDNLNAYYDPKLKDARLTELPSSPASVSSSSILPTAPAWRRCLPSIASPRSCISRRRPACAIR
jgi:NAD(P)-dependent dehydrogenase (short-subunit alcohol dehydrogenase family)